MGTLLTAWAAASLMNVGASKLGKPCPKFTALQCTAIGEKIDQTSCSKCAILRDGANDELVMFRNIFFMIQLKICNFI